MKKLLEEKLIKDPLIVYSYSIELYLKHMLFISR